MGVMGQQTAEEEPECVLLTMTRNHSGTHLHSLPVAERHAPSSVRHGTDRLDVWYQSDTQRPRFLAAPPFLSMVPDGMQLDGVLIAPHSAEYPVWY